VCSTFSYPAELAIGLYDQLVHVREGTEQLDTAAVVAKGDRHGIAPDGRHLDMTDDLGMELHGDGRAHRDPPSSWPQMLTYVALLALSA
jgi:hypothetical protein